jgi:hypothetical protein
MRRRPGLPIAWNPSGKARASRPTSCAMLDTTILWCEGHASAPVFQARNSMEAAVSGVEITAFFVTMMVLHRAEDPHISSSR